MIHQTIIYWTKVLIRNQKKNKPGGVISGPNVSESLPQFKIAGEFTDDKNSFEDVE